MSGLIKLELEGEVSEVAYVPSIAFLYDRDAEGRGCYGVLLEIPGHDPICLYKKFYEIEYDVTENLPRSWKIKLKKCHRSEDGRMIKCSKIEIPSW